MGECLYGHDTAVVSVYAHEGREGLDSVSCCTYFSFLVIALVLNSANCLKS